MILEKTTYRWWWNCLMAGMLLIGCTDKYEEEQSPRQDDTLQLRTVTRTDGYTRYTPIAGADADIALFQTTASELVNPGGQFAYSDGEWTSNLVIKEETQYYLYGYMPAGAATGTISVSATDLSGDYSKGVDLTMTGLPAITIQDICVLVGVQRVESATASPEEPTVTEGNYSYLSGIKNRNYVNLLMDHLYSSLEIRFKIDPEYAKLRSLHLKTVILSLTYANVNATLKLRKGQGIGNPEFTTVGSADHTATLLASKDGEKVLNEEHVSSPLTLGQVAYCAPIIFNDDDTYITITSTYDVWDRDVVNHSDQNNLGERTATNKIRIDKSMMKRGYKNTITLTVDPTYLYVLSDWDNPGFVAHVN